MLTKAEKLVAILNFLAPILKSTFSFPLIPSHPPPPPFFATVIVSFSSFYLTLYEKKTNVVFVEFVKPN